MYSSAAHLAHAGHSMIAPSGTLVDKNKDPLRGAAQTLFFHTQDARLDPWECGKTTIHCGELPKTLFFTGRTPGWIVWIVKLFNDPMRRAVQTLFLQVRTSDWIVWIVKI